MVIEDFQNEYVPQRDNRKASSKAKVFLAFFAAWFVLLVITMALFFKPIKATLESTDAIYILRNIQRLRKSLNLRESSLCFVNLSNGKPVLVTIDTEVQKGGISEYHDALEGLLAGPNEDALKNGNVSLIKETTKLEGFAKSEKLCFVCLSKEFLNSSDMDVAKQQVQRTVLAINPMFEEVIILVDGQEV